MRDFRKLDVWQKAHALALEIYRHTEHFPRSEQFGLPAQMRRAGSSIPANLAEGCGRSCRLEMARFVDIASDSANELNYFIELAADLHLLERPAAQHLSSLAAEVARMLVSFGKTLRTSD